MNASSDIPIADSIFINVSIAYNQDLDTVYTFGFQIGNFPVTLINLSGQTATIDSMANILNALDIPYQSYNYLPYSISNKLAIFLSLGCVSPAHTLTANEYQMLISYLNGGGRLYLEGYYFWFFNTNNLLQPWFRSTIQSTPAYFFNELKGNPDGPTSGMDLKYNGKMYLGIYELQPDSGAVNLLVNPGNKPIQYAFDEGSYRVIGSACEFGQIQDSLPPSTKSDLMKVYLDYFGVDLSGIREFFHADRLDGCTDMSFSFSDDSYGPIVSRSWSFPGGTPAVSTDINPQVVYSEPGSYDVTLEVSNGTATRTITKNGYITVNSCEGISKPAKADDFEIYPNPATDVVSISFLNQNHNYASCVIRKI